MWVRGLKQDNRAHHVRCIVVAPYVGAWIETLMPMISQVEKPVAPYVGAWIETICFTSYTNKSTVAPYVGAWIETTILVSRRV